MCEGWGGAEVARALPANFDQISVKAPTVAFRYIRLTLYFRYKCTNFVRYVRYTTRARCRQRRCPKIGCPQPGCPQNTWRQLELIRFVMFILLVKFTGNHPTYW